MSTGTPAPQDDLDFGQTIRGLAAGQRLFQRYLLKSVLGRGGMGVVWLAEDEQLECPVALKFLPEIVTHDRQAIAELKREVLKSRALNHHHIVRVHDFVTDGNAAAISMEYVDGGTLSDARLDLPGGAFEPEALREWVRQLCSALTYAHDTARLIHRDLKPKNLMLTAKGELKVADFGISRSITDSASLVSLTSASSGSPPYMSPQQVAGEDPRPTDDIYAVGATLYELLTSRPPFYRGGALAIMDQVKTKIPDRVNERRQDNGIPGEVSAQWEETIAACLEKDPAKRPQSVAEVWGRLNATASGAAAARAETAATESMPTTVSTEMEEEVRTPVLEETPGAGGGARRKPLLIAAAAIVFAVLLGVGIWAAKRGKNNAVGGGAVVQVPTSAHATAGGSVSLAAATKDAPFVNSLGMKFVPVPITGGPTDGKRVLFGVWDVRVQDFEAFVTESGYDMSQGEKMFSYRGAIYGQFGDTWRSPGFAQTALHPVVGVSWEDAKAFCAWLTKRERAAGKLAANEEYRLPSDHEWSCAVGIGDREDAKTSPKDRDGKLADVFPWGTVWPPPKGSGNYGDESAEKAHPTWRIIKGYDDGYADTSPAGSFTANNFGLYDMSGNVWQWCEDLRPSAYDQVVRGGSFFSIDRTLLLSSYRRSGTTKSRFDYNGFRVVVSGLSSMAAPSTTPAPAATSRSAGSLAAATREKPFVNTLGMKLVPVPITGGPTDGERVLFGVWDVRVQDYAAYAAENAGVNMKWKDSEYFGEKQGPTHPVVNVSWEDAKAFCLWLTQKERAAGKLGAEEEYRLPSDHEWSCAVGIGEREDASASPQDKDKEIADVYPWGSAWPPPNGAGNYVGEGEALSESFKHDEIEGYKDGYKFTSPVGSFAANKNGLYDMGGNVWQWCEDLWDSVHPSHFIRGGSFQEGSDSRDLLLSSCRPSFGPTDRYYSHGFRVVVAGVSAR